MKPGSGDPIDNIFRNHGDEIEKSEDENADYAFRMDGGPTAGTAGNTGMTANPDNAAGTTTSIDNAAGATIKWHCHYRPDRPSGPSPDPTIEILQHRV